MTRSEYELGDAEFDVLRALWEGGPGTVRQVMAHLPARRRRVAYTTVQTLLNRLEHKGYVACDRADLAHVFRAKLTRERSAGPGSDRWSGSCMTGQPGPWRCIWSRRRN
jgi:BlaI family penicillinase repressor